MFTVIISGLSVKCAGNQARNFHIVVATYLTFLIQLPFITIGINMAVVTNYSGFISLSIVRCSVAQNNPVTVIRSVLLHDVPTSVQ
jgi:hypothetical protein